MRALKLTGLLVAATAAVIVPIYADWRGSAVTHPDWARMLTRALELEGGLPEKPTPPQLFSALSWKGSLVFTADNSLSATGVAVQGATVVATADAEIVYPLTVITGGDYRVRARMAGSPDRPAAVEFIPAGRSAPAGVVSLAPSSTMGWVDGGALHLDRGAYSALVRLPSGASLEMIEVAPPCVSPVEPLRGWQENAVTDSVDLAVTVIKAIDKESELPAAEAPLEFSEESMAVQSPGPRSAVFFVDLPTAGLYTISAFGTAGNGQGWIADACRKAIVCPPPTLAPGPPEWRVLMTAPFSAGRHSFTVALLQEASVQRLRAERKKAAGTDYVAAVRRLGLEVGDGPVSRARADEAEAFVKRSALALLSGRCGDIVLPQGGVVGLQPASLAGPALGTGEIGTGQPPVGRPTGATRVPDARGHALAHPHDPAPVALPRADADAGTDTRPDADSVADPDPAAGQRRHTFAGRRRTAALVRARASLRRWLVDGHLASPRDEAEARDLAAAASEHGLCGLLHADIVSRGRPWPPAQVDSLRETQRLLLVRGVRQLDAAARVSTLLRDRGLRSLPLKGASLVETLYDSVADRAMADVDILALDDWQASMRALREAGFRDSGAADHARCFEDPVTGTLVELHHSITSCPGLFPVDAEGLWARSVEGKGQIARRPSVEDLLVHLALHAAFQHGLVLSLVQYLDFRRLFERTPPDHERLLAIAQASGALGALAAAVAAATAVVGLDRAGRPRRRAVATRSPRAAPRSRGRTARSDAPGRSFGPEPRPGAVGARGSPSADPARRNARPARAGSPPPPASRVHPGGNAGLALGSAHEPCLKPSSKGQWPRPASPRRSCATPCAPLPTYACASPASA